MSLTQTRKQTNKEHLAPCPLLERTPIIRRILLINVCLSPREQNKLSKLMH